MTEEQPTTATGKARIAIVAAVATVAVLATVGVAIYRDQIAPFRTTVLNVNGAAFDMDYVLKRAVMSGGEPLAVLQAITFEALIREKAVRPPFNIAVSEQDIDQRLREMARGNRGPLSDAEFAEWYRQQINESRLSEAAFRDLTRTLLLSSRLRVLLAERVPTVAEQVHLQVIALDSLGDARKAKARLDAGEDFARVAGELNAEESLRANGGDLGWNPRGALAASLAPVVFDKLGIGQASEPLPLDDGRYAIFRVTEKSAAREVQGAALQALKDKVLDDWMEAELAANRVEYLGFNGGYDSETDAWIKWQLQKMKGDAR